MDRTPLSRSDGSLSRRANSKLKPRRIQFPVILTCLVTGFKLSMLRVYIVLGKLRVTINNCSGTTRFYPLARVPWLHPALGRSMEEEFRENEGGRYWEECAGHGSRATASLLSFPPSSPIHLLPLFLSFLSTLLLFFSFLHSVSTVPLIGLWYYRHSVGDQQVQWRWEGDDAYRPDGLEVCSLQPAHLAATGVYKVVSSNWG